MSIRSPSNTSRSPAIPPTSATVDCYANIVLPTPPVVTDNCGNVLIPTGPVESTPPDCEGDHHLYLDLYGLRREQQAYVHTVTIEYEPFAAIPPTSATVDCYATSCCRRLRRCNRQLREVLIPTGPVESTPPDCEGTITYTWTYTDCEGNSQAYVHTVTIEYEPFAAIPPTSATVDCMRHRVADASGGDR